MDLSAIDPILLVASMMVAATPILLAAIGELVVEKAGVLNLGVEGMMIIGAVVGFIVAVTTGSPILGFLAAAAGSAVFSMIFGLLTQYLLSNQVATGLALTLFGLGFSALLGQSYVGIRAPVVPDWNIPLLADIPVIGPILFQHDPMIYLSLILVAAVWAFLKYTRAGLILRAVGESHDSAHALGYKVVRIRMAAIAFGGACAGLGGAYLSLVRVPQWTEGMTAGAGWIALAIVVFASWKPWRVLLGAYLFGGITVLQLNLQAAGVKVPVEILSMSPYLITILVLVIISADRSRAALNAPASLGRIFHASN
jgi:simple sugar transport system permease protein